MQCAVVHTTDTRIWCGVRAFCVETRGFQIGRRTGVLLTEFRKCTVKRLLVCCWYPPKLDPLGQFNLGGLYKYDHYLVESWLQVRTADSARKQFSSPTKDDLLLLTDENSTNLQMHSISSQRSITISSFQREIPVNIADVRSNGMPSEYHLDSGIP